MCWGCNPLCGGCKPPSKRAAECPECGWMNILTLQAKGEPKPVGCEKCGYDLTERSVPTARKCARFGGVVCANPCGLAGKMFENPRSGKCVNIVEPDEWHALADG